ncbi:hypothetical protein BC826DRAFT_1057446, partial [Russula brevipes]
MMTQSFHIRKSSENIPRLVHSGLQVQTNWSHIFGFGLDPMYMDMARNTVCELIKGTLISGHSLRGYIQFSWVRCCTPNECGESERNVRAARTDARLARSVRFVSPGPMVTRIGCETTGH